ncbi:type I polyketide synthase [Streptomyces sp. NPDC002838]|uniref:type I polyketide synthase n=1 Tax=Streptomyces sp. NPDC002838 TaxID=3154436 RepID=UPI00332B8FF6
MSTAAAVPAAPSARSDAIAVIGMACRLPGAPDPGSFWELLRTGRDAITDAPAERYGDLVPRQAPFAPSRRPARSPTALRAWEVPPLAAPAESPSTSSTRASGRHAESTHRTPPLNGQTLPAGALGTARPDDPAPPAPPKGGFLTDVAGFDAGFFGIAPREAAAMDPQQRLTLELAWEALEDAFVVPGSLRGTDTGVFVGAMADDYAQLTHARGGSAVTPHTLPGISRGVIANRLSNVLGLGGPSLTVDTGQSSGLASVHLACAALRRGESGIALAGAVHLNLAPGSVLATTRFGALSPDGRCHTFDARANGYVRGEGGVLLVLKPLARALADGDRLHCVVLGSAMNSDGGPDPLTVPGRQAQEDVLRRACAAAGVVPGQVQYVELHGTGTRAGDPVEAAALGAVFGGGRSPGDALRVGSAKTNVGHLEGAAGMVGLLKTALCIRHRQLAPSLNFTTPHPDIPLAGLGLHLQSALTDWPRPDRPPLAGVSSFGMGGANCHVVVTAPPAKAPPRPGTPGAAPSADVPPPVPWLLSARTAPALRAQAHAVLDHLRRTPATQPVDAARTLATARTHHEHRAALLSTDGRPPVEALEALAEGRPAPGVTRGRSGAGAGLAVLFTGQGAHWPGAGRGLYAAFPAFAQALDEICGHLDPHLDRPLRDLMLSAPDDPAAAGLAQRTDYAQPALFALQTALLRLLGTWGVRPSVLAGHSVGELAAAHASGVFSARDAAAVVAARGRLMHRAGGEGAMLAVQATEEEIRAALPEVPGAWDIAAVNSPESVVVSGETEAVERMAAHWAAQGRRTRRLRVGHAFHSPLMEQVLEDFRRVAAGIDYLPPRIPVVSNVTGGLATAEQLCSPDYWTRHIRATVRFADGIRTLDAYGTGAYVELGPEPALAGQAARSLPPVDSEETPAPTVTATLRPGHDEPTALLTAVGRLHGAGQHVDWSALFGPGPRADLPTYAFQRNRHWLPDGPAATRTAPALVPDADASGPPEPPRESVDQPYWQRALAGRTGRERYRTALRLVRSEAAAVLGHPGPAAVEPHRSFRDTGFDSVTGVEYRDRLAELTGLRLPATLVFDRPTPADLTEHLLAEVSRTERQTAPAALAALDRLRTALREEPPDPVAGERLADGLRELLSGLPHTTGAPVRPSSVPADATDLTEKIGTATDDEIFALIDHEFDA